MKAIIIANRTCDIRINRKELVQRLQQLGYSVTYFGIMSDNKLHDDYAKFSINFVGVRINRINVNPFKEISSLFDVYSKIKSVNCNLIIIYGVRLFPTVVLASKLAGVDKIICVANGSGQLFELKGIKGFLIKSMSFPLMRLALAKATKVYLQNKDIKKLFERLNLLKKDNYHVVNGSGVNLSDYTMQQLPKERIVFTLIGRLSRAKGVNEFLNAATNISSRYNNVEFIIVGPKDDDKHIDNDLFDKCIKENKVIYVGAVTDVRPYLVKTSVFVLPTRLPEGVPRSTLEAMAMGRPIITTNVPGCRETVVHKDNGLLINPNNIQELVNAMEWMIKNKDQLQEMGLKSRKICEDKFDVYKINEFMLSTAGLTK